MAAEQKETNKKEENNQQRTEPGASECVAVSSLLDQVRESAVQFLDLHKLC